jgi:uncharacterized OsmC-like protein
MFFRSVAFEGTVGCFFGQVHKQLKKKRVALFSIAASAEQYERAELRLLASAESV